MSNTGLHRKGIVLILGSLILTFAGVVTPFILTACSPTHEVFIVFSGWKALLAQTFYPLMFILYATGAARYSDDKGYGIWMGLLLSIASLPGLIVLMFLPDHKEVQPQIGDKAIGHHS